MVKSILVDGLDWCYICGRPRQSIHHVFFGTANRKISDKNGFIVPLCNDCHTGPFGWVAEKMGRSGGMTDVVAYYGSSSYDTFEMSRLIDEIVAEAKDLGIETMPPEELERLIQSWGR